MSVRVLFVGRVGGQLDPARLILLHCCPDRQVYELDRLRWASVGQLHAGFLDLLCNLLDLLKSHFTIRLGLFNLISRHEVITPGSAPRQLA